MKHYKTVKADRDLHCIEITQQILLFIGMVYLFPAFYNQEIYKELKLYYAFVPYFFTLILYCCCQEEEVNENLDTLTNFFKYFVTIQAFNFVIKIEGVADWTMFVTFCPIYSITFWSTFHIIGMIYFLLCEAPTLTKT